MHENFHFTEAIFGLNCHTLFALFLEQYDMSLSWLVDILLYCSEVP